MPRSTDVGLVAQHVEDRQVLAPGRFRRDGRDDFLFEQR